MTEDEILKLICSGGRAAEAGVKALYQETAPAMLRFFVCRGVSADEAKDILQESFVKIVRGAPSYSGQGEAKAWIWQVARKCLTDHLRKQMRLATHETIFNDEAWSRLEEITADPAPSSTRSSVDECVAAGIDAFGKRMPDRAYALTLQMEGTSIEDIARRIGRTVGATKEYLSQCRKKLLPFVAHCMELLPA